MDTRYAKKKFNKLKKVDFEPRKKRNRIFTLFSLRPTIMIMVDKKIETYRNWASRSSVGILSVQKSANPTRFL